MTVDLDFASISEASMTLLRETDTELYYGLYGTIRNRVSEMQDKFPQLDGYFTYLTVTYPRRLPGTYILRVYNPEFRRFIRSDPTIHESEGVYYSEQELENNGSRINVLIPIGEDKSYDIKCVLTSLDGSKVEGVAFQNQLTFFDYDRPRPPVVVTRDTGRAVVRVISF